MLCTRPPGLALKKPVTLGPHGQTAAVRGTARSSASMKNFTAQLISSFVK
jgi:hypothetical protein